MSYRYTHGLALTLLLKTGNCFKGKGDSLPSRSLKRIGLGEQMGPERIIQNDILRFLWSKDIYCFQIKTTGTWDPTRATFRKPSPMYKRGVADILGVLPDGKFFAI